MSSHGRFWRVGTPPLKARLASAVYWILDHVCDWTGHLKGCWILNHRPVRTLWWWANEWNVREWRHGAGAWGRPESTGSDAELLYDGTPELRSPTEGADR